MVLLQIYFAIGFMNASLLVIGKQCITPCNTQMNLHNAITGNDNGSHRDQRETF
jgi:hypothetical protein